MKLTKQFAIIRWRDAHCVSGATELSEHEIPHAPAHYTRYGFILRHDDAGVTIASEHSDEATYRNIDFIPAGMIEELVIVKLTPIKAKAAKKLLVGKETPSAQPE